MIRGFMSLYGHSRIPQKKLCRRQALILRWTFYSSVLICPCKRSHRRCRAYISARNVRVVSKIYILEFLPYTECGDEVFVPDDIADDGLYFVFVAQLCVSWIPVVEFEPLQFFAERFRVFQIEFLCIRAQKAIFRYDLSLTQLKYSRWPNVKQQ